MLNPYGKVVLISGASSGIGEATAKLLSSKGMHVYSASRRAQTGRRLDDASGGFIEELRLDVTSDNSVASAFEVLMLKEGRVDVLINCAGIGIAGAVEDASGDDALRQMDTNFAGAVRMIRAILPGMRARRSGLIVNIGSVGGIFPVPFQSLYSASKAAIDTMNEALRIELKPWNVHATLVAPGDIQTGFTAARMYTQHATESEYDRPFRASIAQMEFDETNGAPPETVAKAIASVITRKNPPVRIVVGFKYKLFAFLRRILPLRLVGIILNMMYPQSKKGD